MAPCMQRHALMAPSSKQLQLERGRSGLTVLHFPASPFRLSPLPLLTFSSGDPISPAPPAEERRPASRPKQLSLGLHPFSPSGP